MRKFAIAFILILVFMTMTTAFAEENSNPGILTLDTAIEKALQNNYDLRNAKHDIDRAFELRKKADENLTYIPVEPGSGTEDAAIRQSVFGVVRTDTAWQMSKKNYDMKEESIIYAVENTYYNVQKALREVELSKLSVEESYQELNIASTKERFGTFSKHERFQAEQAYRAAKEKLEAANKVLDSEYVKLNNLVGLPTESRLILSDFPVYEKLDNVDVDVQVSRVTADSNAVWLAEKQSYLAELELDLYTFNIPGNLETYQAKKIDIDKTKNDVLIIKQQLENSVRSAYYSIKHLEEQYQILNTNIASLEESIGLAKLQFELGLITKLELAKSENTLANLKKQQADLIAQHKLLKIVFYKPWVMSGM